MSRILRVLVLGVIFVSAGVPAIAQGTTVSGVSFSGPGLGSPAPIAAFVGTTVAYEIFFGSIAPVDMTVSLTGTGAVSVFFSTFLADTVFNHTGATWTDYHFILGTGSGSTFIPSTSADGLSFAPAPPPLSDIFTTLSQHEDTLDWTGGVVPSGGPGVNFSFTVNVASSFSSFTVREVPTVPTVAEPATLLLLTSGLAGLAGIRWRRHRCK